MSKCTPLKLVSLSVYKCYLSVDIVDLQVSDLALTAMCFIFARNSLSYISSRRSCTESSLLLNVREWTALMCQIQFDLRKLGSQGENEFTNPSEFLFLGVKILSSQLSESTRYSGTDKLTRNLGYRPRIQYSN